MFAVLNRTRGGRAEKASPSVTSAESISPRLERKKSSWPLCAQRGSTAPSMETCVQPADVHLVSPRLVRGIGEPAAVRRNMRTKLLEAAGDERGGRGGVAGYQQ